MAAMLHESVVSHVLQFLQVSDRKEAALVSRKWYNASLHPRLQRDVIVKCHPPTQSSGPPSSMNRRKLTHLTLDDWDLGLSEDQFITLLCNCPSLQCLDISRCNSLFLSGKLLDKDSDVEDLSEAMVNVTELKLGCLRHMTDVTFLRLVSTMSNLTSLSMSSTNMIFGSGLYEYEINKVSSAMLNFSTVLKFISDKAPQLKMINLSQTAIPDDSLSALAKVEGLSLEELILHSCCELTDKGIKTLTQHQTELRLLDISGCKELASGKHFVSNLSHLKKLHTLLARKVPRLGQCDVNSLGDMKHLEIIDMGETLNLYEPDIVKGLCGLSDRLKSVSLPYCPDLRDRFVVSLSETNVNLTHLDLTSCLQLTDASLHAINQNLLSLRSLKLAYCRGITDLGILGYPPNYGFTARHIFDHDHEGCPCTRPRESKIFNKPTGFVHKPDLYVSQAQTKVHNGEIPLYKLSNLKSLRVLDLSSCNKVTDFSISKEVTFTELRCLFLGNLAKVTDNSVKVVAGRNPSLEVVSLKGNSELTNAGVSSLVSLCRRLSSLDVSSCDGLTDGILDVLITKAARLRHLDISFCSNLTQEKVANLEQRLPKLKVIFRPYLY